MGHGPTLQNHNKFLAPLLAPGIVPSSYSESFLRLVCDFFPEPADRAQVIDAHLTALLERSRDTLLFRYLIRESLLPDRCESPASVFLSACFPDSGVPVPFRGYHGSGQWVNLFRSLRILLEFEARYKTFDGSSLVIKMVKAISKEQRRKRSDPRKVAAARGIMRLLLLFCPMDKGQADGVRYNGIEQDGALSCYWRRWLDRNSFGGLPSEIACEIMFSSWMFR